MYVLSRIGFGTDVMRSLWVERSRTITSWCADRLTALLTATLTAVLTDEFADGLLRFDHHGGSGAFALAAHSNTHSNTHRSSSWPRELEGLGRSDARDRAAPVVVDGPA